MTLLVTKSDNFAIFSFTVDLARERGGAMVWAHCIQRETTETSQANLLTRLNVSPLPSNSMNHCP